jgi:hypothetical protein
MKGLFTEPGGAEDFFRQEREAFNAAVENYRELFWDQ